MSCAPAGMMMTGGVQQALASSIVRALDAAVAAERAGCEARMIDAVQGELVELGTLARLDTGESLRGFANGRAAAIIDAYRSNDDHNR